MSQPKIAAMLPSLVKEHLQPVEMTVASCRLQLIVAQSRAPIGSPEAAGFSATIECVILMNKI